MQPHEKWFDREFSFTLPPSRFAGIVERLRGTPGRVEERTLDMSLERLVWRHENKWSIQEHAGHLLDLEPLWHRRAEQLFAGAAELEPAELNNRKTDEAQHNTRARTVLLTEFRNARSQFVELLERADEAMIVRSARHPRLQQPMRLLDLAFFVAEHDDHHLATMTALRRRCGLD